jgi:catechol 2,3-dioxygenase-like lactoylglutathione lyase family enzyme
MLADARIVYLFVYVTDLARSRRFYENTLGLEVLAADEDSVQYDCGEVILALNVASQYGITLPSERDNSTDIVFLVDDLLSLRDSLDARGVEFNKPVEYEIGRLVDFYDPDNHWYTLYEPSAEAMSWPSGAKIAAVQANRNGRAAEADGTLRGAELIYAFFFVPDAAETQTFYHEHLGLRDIEGGPCSQASAGDEDGVIKYDTGGIMLTTHFYDQTLPPLEPDEHGCPPRILDLAHMKGVAPAWLVPDVHAAVAEVRRRRPGFEPVVKATALGIVARCEDPGGHMFFLWEPAESALDSRPGEKIREIVGAPV